VRLLLDWLRVKNMFSSLVSIAEMVLVL